jgi:hypothetical protein
MVLTKYDSQRQPVILLSTVCRCYFSGSVPASPSLQRAWRRGKRKHGSLNSGAWLYGLVYFKRPDSPDSGPEMIMVVVACLVYGASFAFTAIRYSSMS